MPLNDYQRERAVVGWNPSSIGINDGGCRVTNEDLGRAEQFVSDPTKTELGVCDIVLVDPEPRLRLMPLAITY